MFNPMVEHEATLNAVFGALADPTRRRLLELLSAGERRVTELARPFRISLAAISKHLQVLERAGLIRRTRAGRVHRIEADPDALKAARVWMERFAQHYAAQFDAIDRLLAEQKDTEQGRQRKEKP